MRISAKILLLKSNLSGIFSFRFSVNLQKFQLKWKILKHFMRPEQQRGALRKLFSLPPDKSWTKISLQRYAGIYRHLLSKCFENAVFECLEMVQFRCFFLTATRNMFAGKLVRSFLAVLQEYIFFKMLSELRFVKWLRFFEQNCIVKRVIFFVSFCWPWDFLQENLKWKDELQIWGFE